MRAYIRTNYFSTFPKLRAAYARHSRVLKPIRTKAAPTGAALPIKNGGDEPPFPLEQLISKKPLPEGKNRV